MNNLQDATERICELKGSLIAIDALLPALVETLPAAAHGVLAASFDAHCEAARTVLLHTPISEHVIAAFERDATRMRAVLTGTVPQVPSRDVVEPVMLTTTRVSTFLGSHPLTGASGFFFRRGSRLFLVTNLHVLADGPSNHFPDRVDIAIHTHDRDLTQHAVVSLPLYTGEGQALWRQVTDSAGTVDVAALEIDAGLLPPSSVLQAFEPADLQDRGETVAVGDALTVIGFPLGFHDTTHYLAVARAASIASAYGVRFQQRGCFLTDARTHRGSSGAPVLRRRSLPEAAPSALPWQLIGVHSTRMDMRPRDPLADESLGLNCAWYADVLMALTE